MRAEFESREKNSNRNLNKNWVSIRDKRHNIYKGDRVGKSRILPWQNFVCSKVNRCVTRLNIIERSKTNRAYTISTSFSFHLFAPNTLIFVEQLRVSYLSRGGKAVSNDKLIRVRQNNLDNLSRIIL